MLGYTRITRMIRTMAQRYMHGETALSIQIDDLPEDLIIWLDENGLAPAVVDDKSLEFKTEEELLLFKLRWS